MFAAEAHSTCFVIQKQKLPLISLKHHANENKSPVIIYFESNGYLLIFQANFDRNTTANINPSSNFNAALQVNKKQRQLYSFFCNCLPVMYKQLLMTLCDSFRLTFVISSSVDQLILTWPERGLDFLKGWELAEDTSINTVPCEPSQHGVRELYRRLTFPTHICTHASHNRHLHI